MTDQPTPMMAQYLAIRDANPGALLFYRMGDFYEMFFDDAVAAAAALDIALTRRGTHQGQPIPMCGVPVHAAESYLLTLIRKGFRVAVCEQTEDPAEAKKRGSKSVVARDVVRLVTPGTLSDASLLADKTESVLAAFYPGPRQRRARRVAGQAAAARAQAGEPAAEPTEAHGRFLQLATNALSDVYAMGGKPIMALAIVGMPINVLPHDVIAAVLKGGESVCAEAGIPLAGGHSIDSVEPIYGLVAIGVVDPRRVKRNAGARAGDVLILGKPLGVGVLSAALKKDRLDSNGYAAMIAATTKLNRPGAATRRGRGSGSCAWCTRGGRRSSPTRSSRR